MKETEYSASQIRKILQQLFPQRRLVLSQFTLFNHIGVARPTGTTSRRGRRCYRLEDILSIASVLMLKEEGIPLKNVEGLPALVQENADRIFATGPGVRLAGCGAALSLRFPGESWSDSALESYLGIEGRAPLFWGYDIGLLSSQLQSIARGEYEAIRKAA